MKNPCFYHNNPYFTQKQVDYFISQFSSASKRGMMRVIYYAIKILQFWLHGVYVVGEPLKELVNPYYSHVRKNTEKGGNNND